MTREYALGECPLVYAHNCHVCYDYSNKLSYDYYYGCHRYLRNGKVCGNSTGHTDPGANWDRATIVSGTKIGFMLDFDPDDTATVTAYKDGVRAGVMSTGSLRGPLYPAVWFDDEAGTSIQFVPSHCPPS